MGYSITTLLGIHNYLIYKRKLNVRFWKRHIDKLILNFKVISSWKIISMQAFNTKDLMVFLKFMCCSQEVYKYNIHK